MNVLFPYDDKDTTTFLKRISGDLSWGLPPELRIGQRELDLNNYLYRRDRLSQLRHLYATPPPNLRVALRDTRNTTQLYTLWTALIIFVLTIIFGVISSVTSIISTRATLRALDVAQQALQLQIEQNALQQLQQRQQRRRGYGDL